MTEAQWLTSAGHAPMLNHLGQRMTPRKGLLFGCACARQMWQYLTLDVNRKAVETSEAFADGEVSRRVQRHAWQELEWEPVMYWEWPIDMVSGGLGYRPVTQRIIDERRLDHFPEKRDYVRRDRDWCDVIRELFGNPFRPIVLDCPWRTWNGGMIPALALGIYEERAWERLPILADALEDADCADEGLLAHCRGPGPHYRGCWAVDTLLERK
jgi:hypothetical protein